ncbi:MAG: hypothetical protein IPL33_21275 [Sphingobacteriales bacterium]|jgi:hypothetical protein|nr:hypothetical protein [Sphingobacteriales bacterium]MCC7224394.1 hypothetical protein [Chitinophagales bacterium]
MPYFRTIQLFCLLALALCLWSGCLKRGEDDPWLSLVTRDDRISRLWELQTYTLESDHKTETSTVFSSTACDTAGIGGIRINNLSRDETLADTVLNAVIIKTENQIDQTRIYNIKITYWLDIQGNSTYNVTGTYSYNDAQLNAKVSGDFECTQNSWYWETGMRSDWAVTLLNFPTIDASAIAETGLPVRYMPLQTFDVRELRKKELQLEAESTAENTLEQIFLPYTVITPLDTIYNCERTVNTATELSTFQNWYFTHPEPEEE